MFEKNPQVFRQQNPATLSQMKLAEQMIRNGSQGGPVQHPIEGFGRLAQALAGAYIQKNAAAAEKKDRNEASAAMMRGMTAKPWQIPDGEVVFDESGSEITPDVAERNAAPAGGLPGAAAALNQMPDNYYAQQMAPQVAMMNHAQQAAAQAAADERAFKLKLKAAPGGNTGKEETWGKTPIWGKDSNGNPVLGVASDRGNFKALNTDGFNPERQALSKVDLGDRWAWTDSAGVVVKTELKELPPSQRPDIKAKQAKATVVGKDQGEAAVRLRAAEASLPRLEGAVKQLSELGKRATYTVGGKAVDAIRKQAGYESEGATARVKYVAHVKNNILPLLRQTFGAAFTAAEGESLLATLGDPDMSPEQKDAVLDAFINDKKAELQTLKRQAGEPEATPTEKLPPMPPGFRPVTR